MNVKQYLWEDMRLEFGLDAEFKEVHEVKVFTGIHGNFSILIDLPDVSEARKITKEWADTMDDLADYDEQELPNSFAHHLMEKFPGHLAVPKQHFINLIKKLL